MSCFIDIDGEDVWNPAQRVATLFIAQSRAVAHTFGVDSGVGDNIEDQCSIDGGLFASCVETVLGNFVRSQNPPLLSLLEGWLVIGLELLNRAGITLEAVDVPAGLRERGEAMARTLVRP